MGDAAATTMAKTLSEAQAEIKKQLLIVRSRLMVRNIQLQQQQI